MSDPAPAFGPHAALMDRTYRYQRLFYDATRAWFLFGRDRLIAELDPPADARVLEIGCGTGRNLDHIDRRYPGRRLYGLDISSEMLRSARKKLGNRTYLAQGDACRFDPRDSFGTASFDRVVLSFALSMIPDWEGALSRALSVLAPGGQLHLVDFGPLTGYPGPARWALDRWLARFHVSPRTDLPARLSAQATAVGATATCRPLYGGYALLGCATSGR